MTIIEVRTMEIICHNLPRISSTLGRIANELKRIADELTCQTQMKINTTLDRKENDNG